MSAESEVYAALAADTDLAALVADRIYPDTVPEECPLPALAFVRTGGEKFYGLDDSLHAERVRMRVVCWAETRTAANEIGDAVTAALVAAGLPPATPDADFAESVGEFAAVIETDWWND